MTTGITYNVRRIYVSALHQPGRSGSPGKALQTVRYVRRRDLFFPGLPNSYFYRGNCPHGMGMFWLCRDGMDGNRKQNCHLNQIRKAQLHVTSASPNAAVPCSQLSFQVEEAGEQRIRPCFMQLIITVQQKSFP